jgi:hypothetical protein
VLPRHDVACVIHLHSRYSDGTGTVPQIAAAAARAGADAVLLTDHDTLEAKRRDEEGWYGDVLVCVGHEISPRGRDHFLAFGLDEEIDHRDRSPHEVIRAVSEAGGFGFLAHPFSRGNARFARIKDVGPGIPWRDLDVDGYAGIEVWSFLTDGAESLRSLADVARFIVRPERFLDHPPPGNLEGWDRLCARRPVVGIGGLDAHQFGVRMLGRVPLRLMGYARSFRLLRTHCLLDRAFEGDAARDADAIYAALRAGRCYLAMDALAPARGFAYWADGRAAVAMGEEIAGAEGLVLHVRVPRPASLTVLRDGAPVATAHGVALDHPVEAPGAHRVEARLTTHGRERTWILSNPVYVR